MRNLIAVILFAVLVGMSAMPLDAMADSDASTAPRLNHGKKWRIGYYEGGPYRNYPINLRTIVAGLAGLGWMAPVDIPAYQDDSDSRKVWDYLVQHVNSDYLAFVADGYWSANWAGERREKIREEIIQRLNTKQDIDFMLALGTWAGQDLANNRHHTPAMAVSVSDPVRAGISKTAEDSGLDHVHAKCDPDRYIRQLRLFHRLAKFKKLGIVYEFTPEGRTYAALDDIEKVAKERNFSLVTCNAPIKDMELKEMADRVIQCHQQLAPKVDAVFVTVHPGVAKNRMKELVAPFLKYKIPTWSQRGPKEVAAGVLFSISRGGFKAVGRYHAEVMARVFNGEKPRNITQIFEDPKLIAVNMKVAKLIGFEIPNSIMRIADDIYDSIQE